MKKLSPLVLVAALTLGWQTARPTTVIPPSFDQLVGQAELIFQGSVTDVRSQWVGEGAQRHIVSYITFKIEDALKGDPGQSYTIRMFGGKIDGDAMGISDGPEFKVGDDDILFVENNGSQVVPLVGLMHGRFHVKKDQSGREVVTGHDGEAVKNVARLGGMHTAAAPDQAETTLTAADFKAAVRSKLQTAP